MIKISEYIDKRSIWFVLFGFLFFSFWFNGSLFWSQIFFDSSTNGSIWGEVRVYEWLTNKFYEAIVAGQNPFGFYTGMLYPFRLQIGLTDAGNGLFYLPLRPFFSSYTSFSIIMALSQLMANIGMYLLLRKFQISKMVSFIIALAFGYMTFLAVRQGHLNYFMIYVFPWFYLCGYSLLISKEASTRIVSGLGAAVFFALSLWTNFYYFIMIVISIGAFLIYYLTIAKKQLFIKLKERWLDLLRTVLFIILLLIPWIKGVYEGIKFESIPRLPGWGGAIDFSADLFSFLVPSGYNHYINNYYPDLYEKIVKTYAHFAEGAFENFVYPGLIILIGLVLYSILHLKKGHRVKMKPSQPFFFVTIVFFVLTLGPFLHVFGRGGYYLDDTIKLVIPMPYVLLHFIPLFENIRVPGRLVVAFIFFAYITVAYVFEYLIRKRSSFFRSLFFGALLLVFIFDQRYVSNLTPPDVDYPYKIYETIAKDPSFSTVMEIPFTVRDGFTYFGDEDAVSGIVGESYHGKPIIGGYTGRIADYKRAYYYRNPFLGYLGRAMDSNVSKNPIIDQKELSKWSTLDKQSALLVIDFLDIKYVIVDNKEIYSDTVSKTLIDLGFKEMMTDGRFSLLMRPPKNREFLKVDFDTPNLVTYLGMGWQEKEGQFRLAEKKASVMMKLTKKRDMTLRFITHVERPKSVSIDVNKKNIGQLLLTPKNSSYKIDTNNKLNPGINEIHFFFDSVNDDGLTAAEFEFIELLDSK